MVCEVVNLSDDLIAGKAVVVDGERANGNAVGLVGGKRVALDPTVPVSFDAKQLSDARCRRAVRRVEHNQHPVDGTICIACGDLNREVDERLSIRCLAVR